MQVKDSLKFSDVVTWEHRDRHGNLISREETKNLITNAGFDYLCAMIGNASDDPAKYIALTSDTGPASAAHTAVASEYALYGLSRAIATYAHTPGTKVFTLSKTFTCTDDNHVVAMAGLLDAASVGTLVAETVATVAKTLYASETLAITWTLTLS